MADLDVIVPVYNEAESVDELVNRLESSLSQSNIDYNLIFVDDHSTDNTRDIINKHIKNEHSQGNGKANGVSMSFNNVIYDASDHVKGLFENNGHSDGSRVKLLTKRGKKGKAYSILEGAIASSAPYVAMIDGDLQYPPEVLPGMYKLAKEHGVAVAKRRMNGISRLRKVGSYANILVFEKLLLGLDCDTQSGLKVFKRDIIENLTEREVTPWTLDMPLLETARDLGYGVGTIDIKFSERRNGESKVDFVKAAVEIAKSAVKLKFANKKAKKIKPANGNPSVGAGLAYQGRRFITHSHLPVEESAMQTFVPWQKTALFSILAGIFIGLLLNATLTAIVILATLTIVYFIDLVFSFTLLLKSLRNPPEIKVKEAAVKKLKETNLPIYSILCPLYKEANILPSFLEAIDALSWPKEKLDVILLLEEDDEETIEAVKKINVPFYIRTLIVPDGYPKTKPKACNYGLANAKGEYVVIYDAEDRPDPNQLKKAYLAFKKLSAEVVCLQSKLNYYNTNHNLLTRLFSSEYSLWFDLVLPGLQSIDTTIPLGGTSNHLKMRALRYLHGWDSFNVTEDCDLGARLFKAGFKTAIIDSTTYEEANSRMGSWIRQRSRWIKGYFQTFLVHMRNPLEFYKRHGFHSFIFSGVIGLRMIFILVNPILWAMTITYFAARATLGSVIESLFPTPVYYIATICLVFGNFLYFYNFMLGVAKRRDWEVMKYVFFMPFYWIASSIAAVIALYQLAVAPHYWEKTEHGLEHKKSTKPLADIKVSLSFDLGFPNNIFKKLILALSWPLEVVIKNSIDLIGLLEPLKLSNFPTGKKLRILIFNWRDMKHAWSGGAETYLHELASRWVKDGHSVTLFCGWDGKSSRNEKIDGVTIIRRGGFYTTYLFAFLYHILRFRNKFDIVIDSENGLPFFTPIFAGVPKMLLIHHVHQKVFREQLRFPFSKLALFMENTVMPSVYRNSDVVTTSKSSKEDIVKLGFTEESNVKIVTPGVDHSKFGKGKKTDYPSVIYLGRLRSYKNVDVALKAFSEVLKKFPKARFTIAGSGDSSESLQSLAKRLGVDSAVNFTGRVTSSERKALLSKSWFAVQPSSIEGWGITVIEANASGTPVIASDAKGLRDSVRDGETGLLIPVGDVNKLAQAMEKVITNSTLRNTLSQNAFDWSQRFDWEKASKALEAILVDRAQEAKSLEGISFVGERVEVIP